MAPEEIQARARQTLSEEFGTVMAKIILEGTYAPTDKTTITKALAAVERAYRACDGVDQGDVFHAYRKGFEEGLRLGLDNSREF